MPLLAIGHEWTPSCIRSKIISVIMQFMRLGLILSLTSLNSDHPICAIHVAGMTSLSHNTQPLSEMGCHGLFAWAGLSK
jgi:hypothetical protein